MDFDYPPEAEAFRATVREWLDANLTDAVRAIGTVHDLDETHSAGGAGATQSRFKARNALQVDVRRAASAKNEEQCRRRRQGSGESRAE